MTTTILCLAAGIYLLGLLVAVPRFLSALRGVKGDLRLAIFAWAAVFIGQGQMFAQDDFVKGLGSSRIGELYQAGWMMIGGFAILTALLNLKGNIRGPKGSLALKAFTLYGLTGIASLAFSPSPMLTAYKTAQILMDAALIMVVLSALKQTNRPRIMLEFSYFLLLILLASAAMGSFFWPEMAFQNIEGAFAGVLRSVYPQVHANELGLLSSIMLIVSMRRLYERRTGVLRFYWSCSAVLAGAVLFYAQARTSLASCAFALIVMSIYIPRMRTLAAVGILAATVVLASEWMGGDVNLSLENTTANTYLRRGASDEQIETLSGRTDLWRAGWVMFKDSPIVGHGMDAGVRLGGLDYGVASGTNMHSSHLQILVNNGILGYLAWLVFVVSVSRAIWRAPGSIRLEQGRFRLEMILIAFVILFRTLMGHVLVTHAFSLLIFIALFVSAYMSKNGVESRSEQASTVGLLRRKEV